MDRSGSGSGVAVMNDGTVDEFIRLSRNRTAPVVIKHATRDWKAPVTWSPEFFRSRFGAVPVVVSRSRDGVYRPDPELGWYQKDTMPMSRFVDLLSSADTGGDRYYLAQLRIEGPFAELLDDIRSPRYTGSAQPRPHLWVGAKGNVTPLHFDLSHNLLVQVAGRKSLRLFSPEQSGLLYPFPRQSKVPHVSQVDLQHPDLTRFPKFAQARSIEVLLEEGQMIFLPILWWHEVTSLDMAISVNFWWPPDYLQRPPDTRPA
jgi:hypothetical protein